MSTVTGDKHDLLREIRLRLKQLAEPAEYDFRPPAMVSHARDYSTNVDQLKRYAATTVNARIMQFLGTTLMKTWFCLEEYLSAVDRANPYACILSVRMQMEIFAVAYCVVTLVRSNSGTENDNFSERVILVDETLVAATYGTRSPEVIQMLTGSGPSRLRDVTKKDEQNWKATNVLTRISHVSKDPKYMTFEQDYEKLCEYLHPNIAQNMLLLAPSVKHPNFVRLSRLDPVIMDNAIAVSLDPMAAASRGAVEVFDKLTPPFGEVQFSHLA